MPGKVERAVVSFLVWYSRLLLLFFLRCSSCVASHLRSMCLKGVVEATGDTVLNLPATEDRVFRRKKFDTEKYRYTLHRPMP